MFKVFTTIIIFFIVLSGIYANISLFLSYSEVNVATKIQSISRSDGGSEPTDDLYSSECQRRPCQLDELQRQIPSEDPVNHRDKITKTRQDHENQTSSLLNLTCVAAKN